jgi:sulfur carrier protein
MRIEINGEPRFLLNPSTVTQLLELLGHTRQLVAVERNGEMVPKALHASTMLTEGDKLALTVAAVA